MLVGLVVFARHRLQTAVAALLLGIFWTIITFDPIMRTDPSPSTDYVLDFLAVMLAASFAAIAMLLVLPLILLSTAPAKAVKVVGRSRCYSECLEISSRGSAVAHLQVVFGRIVGDVALRLLLFHLVICLEQSVSVSQLVSRYAT